MDFSFIAVLFQSVDSGFPDGNDAVIYADALGNPSYPVVADETQQVFEATTYDGSSLPGKCALSPEMEILTCTTGHGNEDLFDAISTHAQQR